MAEFYLGKGTRRGKQRMPNPDTLWDSVWKSSSTPWTATKVGERDQGCGIALICLWERGNLKSLMKLECTAVSPFPSPFQCMWKRKISSSVRWWVKGVECCWTPSWFSREKGEDLGYPTYCRQVYLDILCKAAIQRTLVTPDQTCVAWECWEEIAFDHYYFPFIPVYKFL